MAKGDILSYKRNKAFPEAGMCLRRERHAVPAVPVRKHTVAGVANPGWLRGRIRERKSLQEKVQLTDNGNSLSGTKFLHSGSLQHGSPGQRPEIRCSLSGTRK